VAQADSLSSHDSTVEVLLGGPSGFGTVQVFAPLATSGTLVELLAVAPSPPGAKGTLVLEDADGNVHLVDGACQ
jgi:hypothetical protein